MLVDVCRGFLGCIRFRLDIPHVIFAIAQSLPWDVQYLGCPSTYTRVCEALDGNSMTAQKTRRRCGSLPRHTHTYIWHSSFYCVFRTAKYKLRSIAVFTITVFLYSVQHIHHAILDIQFSLTPPQYLSGQLESQSHSTLLAAYAAQGNDAKAYLHPPLTSSGVRVACGS